MKKNNIIAFMTFLILILCSCSNNGQSEIIPASKETEITTISKDSEVTNYMQIGKEQGLIFKETLWDYFGTCCNHNWKLDTKDILEQDDYCCRQYQRCLGLFTDGSKKDYTEMNYSEARQYMISQLNITENGFDDLCENSPSGYMESDNLFYVGQGDGGEAGWDCSYIVDYKVEDNNITYKCQRIGFAGSYEDGYWGYEEDLIEEFSFTIVQDDDGYKFDRCDNYNAFFNYFVGFKEDYVELF